MNLKSTYLSLCLSLFMVLGLNAQSSCEYILELFDSFGDGWNGAELTVFINEMDSTVYTINPDDNDGEFNRFFLDITDGDIVRLAYSGGTFEGEVTYQLLDPNCLPVFSDGTFPVQADTVFMDTLTCPSCLLVKDVELGNIRHNRLDVSYEQRQDGAFALIEVGLAGFTPGDGTGMETLSPSSPERVTGLIENTMYDLYIRNICAPGDTTDYLGPFPFTTLFANDVGVVDILSPMSGCNLSSSTLIEFDIFNFGGMPQTLTPMGVSINGIPQGINQPQDGVFTGVLGTDSTFTFKFDRTFDFSEPGEYTITVYTQLEEDSVLDNDTTSITIFSAPTISDLPYQEGFEEDNGFWSIDASSQNSSWAYGEPAGLTIDQAASGDFAWVTNLEGNHENDERSFLVSPCFDFSGLTEDPVLQFAIFLDLSTFGAQAFVETSADGGETWTKLGTDNSPGGVNWYNDIFSDWWDDNGGVEGWHLVAHPLNGLAGVDNARVRITFIETFGTILEGIGVDNMIISTGQSVDMASISAERPTTIDCGDPEDLLTINLFNIGTDTVTSVTVNYQLNDGSIVSETINDISIPPGGEFSYTFMQTYDSSAPGDYEILAWVDALGDNIGLNDTVSLSFSSALGIPYREDFEAGALPNGWEADGDVQVTDAHNAPSFVLSDNIYQFDQVFNAATPAFGPIEMGDSLSFDYRYVQFSFPNDPQIIGLEDSLIVEISTDCGQSYEEVFNVTADNHIVTGDLATVSLSLDNYAGEAIRVRFRAVWGGGIDGAADYWLDIDNINIKRCTGTLTTLVNVQNATGSDQADGSITVEPTTGFEPYTYLWTTGDETATISDLLPGDYGVTITDGQGCSESLILTVDVTTSVVGPGEVFNEVQLMPNPTNAQSRLLVSLSESKTVQVQLYNSLGQLIRQYPNQRTDQLDQIIDLTNQPAGIYYLRLRADQADLSLKLIRTQP